MQFERVLHNIEVKAEAKVEECIHTVEQSAEGCVHTAEHIAEECVHALNAEEDPDEVEPEDRMRFLKRSLTSTGKPAHPIVDSIWFHSIVTGLTLLNTLQMGVAADYPDWNDTWLIAENIFTTGFVVEMVIKLYVLRMQYFHDKANLLDGTLSVLGMLDCWLLPLVGDIGGMDLRSLSVLRVLRLLRLVRIVRLIRDIKPLVLVVQGLISAMSTAFYVFLVCVCVIYVFAIFVTEYLGRPDADLYPGFSTNPETIDEMAIVADYNPHLNFGSMTSSMITLFNMASLTEWVEVVRPIAIKQPIYLPILFCFVTFVGFGVFTVLVGVIVDVILEESRKVEQDYAQNEKKRKLQLLESIEDVLTSRTETCDGLLDQEGLAKTMRESDLLKQLIADIDLPAGWTPGELFTMIDSGGAGQVQVEDFTTSFFRLVFSDDFQQICILEASINQVKRVMKAQDNMIRSLDHKLEANHSEMHADLASIKAALGIAADSQKQVGGEQASVEMQQPSATPATSMSSGKTAEWQSNILREDLISSASDVYHKPKVSKLTACRQIEEALRAALMVVSECIQEEFASDNSSFDSELLDAQSCCSVVRVMSGPSKLATVKMDYPDDSPRCGPKARELQMGKEVGSSRNSSRADSVNRNSELASGISIVARSAKSNDSGRICTKQLAL